MSKGLCIYHANCNDGFAAAFAVWLKHGDAWDYQPAQYGMDTGDLLQIVESAAHYEEIMLVDFSLPRETMVTMAELTNVLVIDHHKTAQEACEGLPFCKFDLTQSGCEATWRHVFGSEPPAIFKYIGDRDLWTFQHDKTKPFCAGLQLYPKTFPAWHSLLYDGVTRFKIVEEGQIVVKLQDKKTKDFVERWRANPRCAQIPVGNDVETVPLANCCDDISERIGALSEGYSFAVGYFNTHDRRVFSLRTRVDVDCGAIAKQFGGGGHPGAAGFSVPFVEILDIEQTYTTGEAVDMAGSFFEYLKVYYR